MTRLNRNSRHFLLFVLLVSHPVARIPRKRIQLIACLRRSALFVGAKDAWNRGDVRAFMDGYWNSPM